MQHALIMKLPAVLSSPETVYFAMVSEKDNGIYTVQSEPQYPVIQNIPKLLQEMAKDGKLEADGNTEDGDTGVFLLEAEQLERYVDSVIAPCRSAKREQMDEQIVREFYSSFERTANMLMAFLANEKYAKECERVMLSVGREETLLRIDAEEYAQQQERVRTEMQRLKEEERRLEGIRIAEERILAEKRKERVSEFECDETYFAKLAGVTYDNSGWNRENRQTIIRELLASGDLAGGQELSFKLEPENPYDHYAVAVYGPDGRQLGYLPKDIARNVFEDLNAGGKYRICVENVTGGGWSMAYGITLRIQRQKVKSEVRRTSYYPVQNIYAEYYSTPADEARNEGFFIDDDGNWLDNDLY